jgi:predicted nucleotidyltransferase
LDELLEYAKMETQKILEIIQKTESPLKKQLLMVGLLTQLLKSMNKQAPVIIGGCALSYYSREVYFTSDIDLAYSDREALDTALKSIGFEKEGRYWVNEGLKVVIEAPASVLLGEDSPLEVVELGEGLQCSVIGIEDLVIDRLNAFRHWKSEIDKEMVELLTRRYRNDLDWPYLEKRAKLPENDTLAEISELKKKAGL